MGKVVSWVLALTNLFNAMSLGIGEDAHTGLPIPNSGFPESLTESSSVVYK
jgi:6-phosphogluconolactonase/glucosamine-6-phosphate isomerase/deaminase